MDMSILAKAFFDIPEAASLPLPGDGGGFPALITGLSGVHRAQLAAALGLRTGRSVLLLTPDEAAAEALAGDLAAFTGERPTLLTGREFVFISADAVSRQTEQRRLGALRELLGGLDADVRVVPVEDRGVLLDVNSYEEYEQVLAMEAQRCGRGKLHAECDILLSVDDVIMNRETMRLLEMVQYTGSLQLASELMNVPYTRSWRQIKNMERQLGVPIVRSAAGGARGGGSLLTEQGTALLEAYQNMSKECAKLSNWLFQEYFSDDFVEKLQNER